MMWQMVSLQITWQKLEPCMQTWILPRTYREKLHYTCPLPSCKSVHTHKCAHILVESLMLNRTSSHMCGSLVLSNVPIEGWILNPMNMASFMALVRLCASHHTVLKLSTLVLWLVMLAWSQIGEGAMMCSLRLSPNVFANTLRCSSSYSILSHLYLYITPLLCVILSMSQW